MRKAALLAVAVAASIAAFAPAAGAATAWKGTVVAKDPARKAIVTASSRGVVRTVRAPGKVRALRVGQRVAVRAQALADGTYRARSVRVAGRAARASVRGVVVRHERARGRYLVSAGGSILAIRARDRRPAALADEGASPGDKVVIVVVITDGKITAVNVDTVGHVSVLELEGIFLGLSEDGKQLRLAVAHRGEVFVTVPDGTALPPLSPGDEIELAVTIEATGTFTLVSVRSDEEGDDGGIEVDEDGEVEVEGTISALSDSSVTVQPGGGTPVTCTAQTGTSLAGFDLGDRVEMECELVGAGLVITELEHEDDDDDDDDDDEDDDDD